MPDGSPRERREGDPRLRCFRPFRCFDMAKHRVLTLFFAWGSMRHWLPKVSMARYHSRLARYARSNQRFELVYGSRPNADMTPLRTSSGLSVLSSATNVWGQWCPARRKVDVDASLVG